MKQTFEIRSGFQFQCNKSEVCQNHKCFWKQRDCYGREPFPIYYDKEGNMPAIKKHNKIVKEYGEPYFPEWTISIATNCMSATCNDFIEPKENEK